ncbi:hypothetical protein P5P86_02020 [Nocardioides sp. BP30]|uniref:hypothetical protein n=1 Tax=Nocardioides sp. BP30 TaxID=3036374 RepID=UPI0024695E5C|nr:hypothetical protein [Nocardioides sp. BP30]WGL52611.1 hypothetical protein P5P86_02020 [Nocardioides sp. BP30]
MRSIVITAVTLLATLPATVLGTVLVAASDAVPAAAAGTSGPAVTAGASAGSADGAQAVDEPVIRTVTFLGTTHRTRGGRRCVLSVSGYVAGEHGHRMRVRLGWSGDRTVGAAWTHGNRFAVVATTPCRPGLLVPRVRGRGSGVAVGVSPSSRGRAWTSALGPTVTLSTAVPGPEGPYAAGTAPASCPNTRYAPGQRFLILDGRTGVTLARGALGRCTMAPVPPTCRPAPACAAPTVRPSYAVVPDRPLPRAAASYVVRIGSASFPIPQAAGASRS